MALARVALGAVALGGCYAGFDSDQGQLRLVPDPAMFTEPYLGLFPANNPLLEGTRLCLQVTCSPLDATCPVKLDLEDCFQQSVEGGTLVGPGCALADGAGPLIWHFAPDLAGCGADPLAYAPVADQFAFDVVPAAEVSAALYQWAEAAAEESLAPAVGASFPQDWTVPEGEPFQVVVGGSLRLPIVLTHPDYAGSVAYDTAAVAVRVVDLAGTAAVETPEPGWLQVVPSPGYVGEVEVTLGGIPQLAGRVVGVPPDVASLQLVPSFAVSEGQRIPLAVRAVARDPSGALLYGLPVEWTVTAGALAVEPAGGLLPGRDYALLRDACLPPPEVEAERREVTLEARFGSVVGTTTFVWSVPIPDQPPDSFTPDVFCQEPPRLAGCGCAGGGPLGSPALGALVVGVLAARVRCGRGARRVRVHREAGTPSSPA